MIELIKINRPVLRWHGGKWRLAPWLISHFPAHRIYVEPFGGAASVLLRKERSYAEVYNDLDGEIVNLFRVLRDADSAERLRRAVTLTPFSRAEHQGSKIFSECPVEAARRLIVRSFMGFGSNGHNITAKTGFRANSNRSGTTPAHDWAHWPDNVPAFVERLRGVVIESRDAKEIIRQHDSEKTLFYVDPPYPHGTRGDAKRARYHTEMTDGEHASLSEYLHGVRGMVAVSGYRCDLYDELYSGWRREERQAYADGAKRRIECLWINERAGATKQSEIFARGA